MPSAINPAELHAYDPSWPARAEASLARIKSALLGLAGESDAAYDHIGSTAVPKLSAKPFIDLQVRVLPLPSDADLIGRLRGLGYERVIGSRPDSPGVNQDLPRGTEQVDPEVWAKSLFISSATNTILHIRRQDSPWGRYTVWFRDWLRAHDEQRDKYEAVKRQLSKAQIGKPDYDDYTRAKTEFFDEVQAEFEAWTQQ